MNSFELIIIGASTALILSIILIYNQIIKLKNQFLNGYAQIDVQLKRRHDLIPKLVETAKAYMSYEQETIAKIVEQRIKVINLSNAIKPNLAQTGSLKNLAIEEGILSQQLHKFIMTVENYPDLKSNTTMLQLMEELSTTENRIAFARQFYNDSVMSFNTYIQQFPNSLLCRYINLPEAIFLEFQDDLK